ncbi:hypothetical protein L9F63_022509, partial [Diploptera punctata]
KEKLPNDVSNCNHYSFLEDIYDLVCESQDVCTEEFFEKLGQELIETTCMKRLQERAFRCLGGNLKEFLTTLDGVHDVLQGEEGASFVCNTAPDGHLDLLFATDRPAVALLLRGSLKAIARRFYRNDAAITVQTDDQPGHYRYRITPSVPSEKRSWVHSQFPIQFGLGPEDGSCEFLQSVPMALCNGPQTRNGTVGCRIYATLCSRSPDSRHFCRHLFRFRRPRGVALSFNEIVKRANTPFVLAISWPDSRPEIRPAEGLELKGQMVYCPESDSILFVGSPFLDGLDGLTGRGLFISDIPLHDATRDVILVGEQARAQDGLRRRMDQLKSSIEEAKSGSGQREREKCVSFTPHLPSGHR